MAAAQVDSGCLAGEEGSDERRCEVEKEKAEEVRCLGNALVERAGRRSMSMWPLGIFFSGFFLVTMNLSECEQKVNERKTAVIGKAEGPDQLRNKSLLLIF